MKQRPKPQYCEMRDKDLRPTPLRDLGNVRLPQHTALSRKGLATWGNGGSSMFVFEAVVVDKTLVAVDAKGGRTTGGGGVRKCVFKPTIAHAAYYRGSSLVKDMLSVGADAIINKKASRLSKNRSLKHNLAGTTGST